MGVKNYLIDGVSYRVILPGLVVCLLRREILPGSTAPYHPA